MDSESDPGRGSREDELTVLRRRVLELEALSAQSRETQERLLALSRRFEAVLAAVPEIIVEVDNDKVMRWLNKAGRDFYGGDVTGRRPDEFFVGDQDTYQTVQPLFNGNEDVFYLESWQRRHDGAARLLAWWCRVLKDPEGHVQGALSSARDITESRLVETELARHRDQLEELIRQRTEEMESFCYSVSHDLRSPLRAISGFAHILLEDHSASLDAEARGHLLTIGRNVARMSKLIDDILRLSRLGRQDMQWSRINMAALVRAAQSDLGAEFSDRKIDLRLGSLPLAFGDEALLRALFANLLANAFKFTAGREVAVIEVDGRQEETETIYTVRDNGVGFDMRYADKLFDAFQRLHNESEFPGTGVGLGIVKRIVDRHGGRIWAESMPNEGAAFHVALPALGYRPPVTSPV